VITLRPWRGSETHFEVDIALIAPDGRRFRRRLKAPVTGRSKVERWARAREQHLLAELLAPPAPLAPPPPTFRDFAVLFLDACRADRLASSTLTNYDVHLRVHILPLLGDRRLDALGERDLVALKARLLDLAPSSAAEVLKTLKALLHRAVKLGHLTRPPLEIQIPRRPRKEPVAYSADETAALLTAAAAAGPHALVAVLLGLDGGLRRGELLALRWADLDLDRRTVTVRDTLVQGQPAGATKTRTEATVGLTLRLTAALTALAAQSRLKRRSSSHFVLTHPDGAHWNEAHFARLLRRLVTTAGIRWLGTHVLRRTCATRIADNGGGVTAVAAQLRHSGLHMASRYVERGAHARHQAVAFLDYAEDP
jgi:integrase